MRRKFLLIALVILIGCGKKEPDSKVVITTVQLRTQAESITAQYMKELKGELMAAMKNSPANAITVCSEKAPLIAEKYSQNGWTISRVSDKNRNEGNKVDEHQAKVFALFADTLQKLNKFDEWLPGNDSIFVFYKPIKTNPICLKCHGTIDQLDVEVADLLTELYPDDKAVGYKAGQLRGMFVVRADIKSGAENLLKSFSDSL